MTAKLLLPLPMLPLAAVPDDEFARLLEHVRTMRVALSYHDAETQRDVLAAIRGRVKWQPDAPDPPAGYHVLAADIVEALDDPRLGPHQADEIERSFLDDR